jgi:hypothetical protein
MLGIVTSHVDRRAVLSYTFGRRYRRSWGSIGLECSLTLQADRRRAEWARTPQRSDLDEVDARKRTKRQRSKRSADVE